MNRKTDNTGRAPFVPSIKRLQAERGTYAAAAHLRAGGVSIITALRLLAPKAGRV